MRMLYRLEELAAATGQSARSVTSSVARGEIKTIRVGARGIRIPDYEFRRLTGAPPREDERPTVLRGVRPSSRGGAK